MDEHPNIHFIDGAIGHRPAVVGTGLDVWEIVEVARDNGSSVAETAAYLEIDPRLVESALRYYGSNREEIEDWIARISRVQRARGSELACGPGSDLWLKLLLDEHFSPEIARDLADFRPLLAEDCAGVARRAARVGAHGPFAQP